MQQPNNHFFASSVATWMVTTPDRDLRALIKAMEREGFPFNLFVVPGPHDADYAIEMFAPRVEGAQWVGFFETKKAGRRVA